MSSSVMWMVCIQHDTRPARLDRPVLFIIANATSDISAHARCVFRSSSCCSTYRDIRAGGGMIMSRLVCGISWRPLQLEPYVVVHVPTTMQLAERRARVKHPAVARHRPRSDIRQTAASRRVAPAVRSSRTAGGPISCIQRPHDGVWHVQVAINQAQRALIDRIALMELYAYSWQYTVA